MVSHFAVQSPRIAWAQAEGSRHAQTGFHRDGRFGRGFAPLWPLGLVAALLAGQYLREEWKPFLLIGVLGSFTTFSSIGFETFELVNEGQLTRAGINIPLSNLAGLAAVWIGYRLTEQVVGG